MVPQTAKEGKGCPLQTAAHAHLAPERDSYDRDGASFQSQSPLNAQPIVPGGPGGFDTVHGRRDSRLRQCCVRAAEANKLRGWSLPRNADGAKYAGGCIEGQGALIDDDGWLTFVVGGDGNGIDPAELLWGPACRG
jgi:hypothetical protein